MSLSLLKLTALSLLFVGCLTGPLLGVEGLVPAFEIQKEEIRLERRAQPSSPFDKTGRKFAVLGLEAGAFEAWAYPLKLFRNFEFSFLLGSSTRLIRGQDIVRWIEVTPAATTLTFTYQSFTVRAIFITPVSEPGAMVLLSVDTVEPLTVVCSFLPVLQPMWPAGIGGQYAVWNQELSAYLISESSRRSHGLVGSPAARGISYTPAHMLSDVPNEFRIDLSEPRSLAGKYVPIYITGGKGDRAKVIETYKRLSASPQKYYEETVEHYRRMRAETLKIKTPVPELDLALEWGKISLEALLVDNPDLGTGLTAGLGMSGTSGRPGFGWFFGGDTFINSMALNSCGAAGVSRQAIAFMKQFQRDDGKMAHEISQAAGYIDWFKDYGYGYIHADTSPFFIVAVDDYFRQTGDSDFVREQYSALKKAFAWSRSTDGNADGLMDNRLAGLGGLEYGALTNITSDIYLSAVWVRSCLAMSRIARAMNDQETERQAGELHERGKQALAEKFWNQQQGAYVFAFDQENRRVDEISAMCAMALMWEQTGSERAQSTLERIHSADLTTDWGIRGLSRKSRFYEPLNYNYGAVWPFTSGWVAAAQFVHGCRQQGLNTVLALARHFFDNQLGASTELFSGSQNVWPQEGVSHQGFSSTGFIFPLVRGLLGLEADAPGRRIVFAPSFPANWPVVQIEDYRVGTGRLSLRYERSEKAAKLTAAASGLEGYTLIFAPHLEPGSRVLDARSGESKMEFQQKADQAVVTVPLTKSTTSVALALEPGVDLLPPDNTSRTGDLNRGLKIISIKATGKQIRTDLEGLAGVEYALEITGSDRVQAVKGAVREGSRLRLKMPAGEAGEFVKATIELEMR
ncbi:MAG: hypothetical protein EHM61_14465 [Acidobacteria bacterium]|nr:MAG: hypothetical protein EHM61_14465 [Acidobacteriota bacterium]